MIKSLPLCMLNKYVNAWELKKRRRRHVASWSLEALWLLLEKPGLFYLHYSILERHQDASNVVPVGKSVPETPVTHSFPSSRFRGLHLESFGNFPKPVTVCSEIGKSTFRVNLKPFHLSVPLFSQSILLKHCVFICISTSLAKPEWFPRMNYGPGVPS